MHNVVFFGTSDFAVPSLKALAADPRFHVIGVVTQPDRPVGRHAQLTASPVKNAAAWLGLSEIRQPEKMKDTDFQDWIRRIGPSCDAFVVVSYGKILPQWLLDLPKRGVINVHGSLLPRWRGASPIQAAIAAGDSMTGVTIMKLDAEMDHGPIIATSEEKIFSTDTGGSLHDRLADLGANLLISVLSDYLDGKIEPAEQNHSLATSCNILTRDDGKIDWTKPAEAIERLVRAYNSWPGTWMDLNGKRLKILAARVGVTSEERRPGEHFISNGLPCISCANGTILEITRIQPEGKSPMSGAEFLRGNPRW